MNVSLDHLPKLIIPIAVTAAIAFLRWRVPAAAPAEPSSMPPLTDLDHEFRITQWKVALLWLLVVGAFLLSSTSLLRISNAWLANLEGSAASTLYPSSAIWWIVPILGSILISWPATSRILPYFLGEKKAAQYIYWTHHKSGFDADKVFRWGTVGITLPLGLITVLAIPVHTTFHDSEMRTREYASMQSIIHRYDQIVGLATTAGYFNNKGQFQRDPAIIVAFDDGSSWSSADNLRDPDPSLNEELLRFLEERTGLRAKRSDETR